MPSPFTHTMSGREDVDNRFGGMVAGGGLGHTCYPDQHKSGHLEVPSLGT